MPPEPPRSDRRLLPVSNASGATSANSGVAAPCGWCNRARSARAASARVYSELHWHLGKPHVPCTHDLKHFCFAFRGGQGSQVLTLSAKSDSLAPKDLASSSFNSCRYAAVSAMPRIYFLSRRSKCRD